jgi:tetratricopeptide (TPR) repeat protein
VRAGDLVAERFEIERRIASGGMGAVYRATDRANGGTIALKTMLGGASRELERFKREAHILAELSHPGLVRYVAHGVADGVAYLAMEWLHGESLKARLAREPLTIPESITLVRRVTAALSVAHAHGVVHRDIKPDNLFLVDRSIDKVKVIDFGIARVGRSSSLTATDVMVGTPRYMAPEQAKGRRDVDARCDVFSLGCVLFECLTGQRAFPGDDVVAVLAKVLLDEAARVREIKTEVPQLLDDLVARMMSKDPAQRPADAQAVSGALASLEPPGSTASDEVSGDTTAAKRQRPRTSQLTRGERRFFSVVLAAAPARDDEAVTINEDEWNRVNDVAERGRAAAADLGARVETLADGSLVATLVGHGNPTDQAARAARCALAIRSAIPEVPMVLASGRGVLAGRLPFGEVIDTAVEMLHHDAASPPVMSGSYHFRGVRLDQLTAGLLDVRFAVMGDEVGLVLRGEREIVEHARTLLGRPTPCVGRERELLTLEATFAECQAEPVARCVLVTAAPGVGKSRLQLELVRAVRARYESTQVWFARGDPIARGSPFGMMAQALRLGTGLLHGEPPDTLRQKLRARVARSVPRAEAQRVAEFLGELVGVPFPDRESVQLREARKDKRLMGDQIRRAWMDLVTAECQQQPVLFVLEDLHWGDLPTVQLVDAALRTLHDKPLMVIALARPEVDEVFPDLWSERGVQRVRLGELTRRASDKLIYEVLGDSVDEATVARVSEQAGGNAFYLEELIRAVAEGAREEMPATVLAMITTRIERFDPEARRVLRAASIFGEVFWRSGVAELIAYKKRTDELDGWLEQLVTAEVIGSRGEGRFPGEHEFVFRHAIVRDAAYAMLTQRDAELGHKMAAAWLVTAGETDAAALAEHYERGGDPQSAVAWYRRAAEQALEGNDFVAANERAERGVRCGATDTELGALRLVQAQAHEWRAKHAEAETCALAAMRWLVPGSRPWFTAAGEVAMASGRLGDFETLVELTEALVDVPSDAAAEAEYVFALARAAIQLLLGGRQELAEVLLGRMENQAAAFGESELTVMAQMDMACALRAHFSGDPGLARRLSSHAADAFERVGDLRMACTQRLNVGYASCELGAYGQSEIELREVLATAERMGLSNVVTATRHNLGMVVARLGNPAEGLALESLAVEAARLQGDPRMEGGSRIYVAKILRLMGDVNGAAHEALTAVRVCATSLPAKAKALATLSDARRAQGLFDDALAAADEAMQILEQLGGVDGEEEGIRLAYAEALHAKGREDAARAAIAEARSRLLERAAKISEAVWRDSFLTNVPENGRTLALAEEWLLLTMPGGFRFD